MRWTMMVAALILVPLAGCGEDPYQNSAKRDAAPPAAVPASAEQDQAKQREEPKQDEAVKQEEPKPAAQEEEVTREKAQFGVGKRGHGYGGGIVTTPVSNYFTVRERIAFDIQIPQAMNLYKAEHDNHGPKSHQEFMDKIIKANGIKLPDLPPGSTYKYDPKAGQLMVEHRQTDEDN